jgi:transcriptional regulator with XRE-family HTH domain
MKIITEKIKKGVRIEFKRPVSEIARELGVSRQRVWNWKEGKAFPNQEYLKRLEEIGA